MQAVVTRAGLYRAVWREGVMHALLLRNVPQALVVIAVVAIYCKLCRNGYGTAQLYAYLERWMACWSAYPTSSYPAAAVAAPGAVCCDV